MNEKLLEKEKLVTKKKTLINSLATKFSDEIREEFHVLSKITSLIFSSLVGKILNHVLLSAIWCT